MGWGTPKICLLRLSLPVEWRRWCCPRCDGNADFPEKLFLPCRRAQAQQSRWFPTLILELARGVRWNVDRFAGSNDGLPSSERSLDFTL